MIIGTTSIFSKKQKAIKTRRSCGFRKLLWKFKITELNTVASQIDHDNSIHHLYKEGFDNLLDGFNEFVIENNITYNNDFGYFQIYSSVAVESTDIIRTAGKFYGHDWFSDVVVSSEETMWYGKVYLSLLITIFYYHKTQFFS
jgi:hypothetical protein